MKAYFTNYWLWLDGFSRFNQLSFKTGWSGKQPRWWLLYLLDYGFCVIFLAGPVCTVSRYAQEHRSGWLWDKLLDVLDRIDTDHGQLSGPALWGSEEPELWVRCVVPGVWTLAILSAFV
jgi:hypothetical protein